MASQLLQGTVRALAKQQNSTQVLHFRPIVIYGMVYRLWSSTRARQALRFLEQFCGGEMYGFLPGKEAMQYWYVQQANIELCLQSGQPLVGWSSDLQKCFNSIARVPSMLLARHLGIPSPVIHAWISFLNRNTRRFQIRQGLGPPIKSSTGMPEGCGMSTVAMTIIDLCFHVYFRAFMPGISTYSYVDNFAVQTTTAASLTRAWLTFLAFCDMWHLHHDPHKTLAWALDKEDGKMLQRSDFQVVTEMRDLGGYFTFKLRGRRNMAADKSRLLNQEWDTLRRAAAPFPYKLQAIYVKFWPSILYGTTICVITDAEIKSLRSAAVHALRTKKAGSNPLLRLSLSTCILADPAFYRIWTMLQDLRRLCSKSPHLLTNWKHFMTFFELDGRMFAGPFSQLVQTLSQMHWCIEAPPTVRDHDGINFNILETGKADLFRRLCDGWLQHVATQVSHRHTMKDLRGMDGYLTRLDSAKFSSTTASRVAALQDGTFRLSQQQAKYDASQTGQCRVCQTADTVQHMCLECPRLQTYQEERDLLGKMW